MKRYSCEKFDLSTPSSFFGRWLTMLSSDVTASTLNAAVSGSYFIKYRLLNNVHIMGYGGQFICIYFASCPSVWSFGGLFHLSILGFYPLFSNSLPLLPAFVV